MPFRVNRHHRRRLARARKGIQAALQRRLAALCAAEAARLGPLCILYQPRYSNLTSGISAPPNLRLFQ